MILHLHPEVDDQAPAGRYFEQSVLLRQREFLARRAEVFALNEELDTLGIVIDQQTGKVRFAR